MGKYTDFNKNIRYGYRKGTTQLVKAEDVENEDCEAVCILCGQDLECREDTNGEKYFCHCGTCLGGVSESYEHMLTKLLVRDRKEVIVPEINLSHIHDNSAKYEGLDKFKIHGKMRLKFDEVYIEQNMDINGKTRRADLIGKVKMPDGGYKEYILEVTAYHDVDTDKIRDYSHTNNDVIEVVVNPDNIEEYTCRYMASTKADIVLQLLFMCCEHINIKGEEVECLPRLGESIANCKNCDRFVYLETGRFVQCYSYDRAIEHLARKFNPHEDSPARVKNFRNNLKTRDRFLKMLDILTEDLGQISETDEIGGAEDKSEVCKTEDKNEVCKTEDSVQEIKGIEGAEKPDKLRSENNKLRNENNKLRDKNKKLLDRNEKLKSDYDIEKDKNRELQSKLRAIRNIIKTSRK